MRGKYKVLILNAVSEIWRQMPAYCVATVCPVPANGKVSRFLQRGMGRAAYGAAVCVEGEGACFILKPGTILVAKLDPVVPPISVWVCLSSPLTRTSALPSSQ